MNAERFEFSCDAPRTVEEVQIPITVTRYHHSRYEDNPPLCGACGRTCSQRTNRGRRCGWRCHSCEEKKRRERKRQQAQQQ